MPFFKEQSISGLGEGVNLIKNYLQIAIKSWKVFLSLHEKLLDVQEGHEIKTGRGLDSFEFQSTQNPREQFAHFPM